MKILMLGGTALIGPHVIRQMADHEITTPSRSKTQIACENVIKGDRENVGNIERALIASQPDVIIDLVPFTLKGANVLVDALKEYRCYIPVVALL